MVNPPSLNQRGIADVLRRLLDQRNEQRIEGAAQTAELNHRGQRHVVRIANLSASGAMIGFSGDVSRGDAISLRLLDQGMVPAQVRWVNGGRVGVVFTPSAGSSPDE